MFFAKKRSLGRKLLLNFLLLVFLASVIQPGPAYTQTADVEADYTKRIDEVYALRSEGKYDRAVEELQKMIEEFNNADEILRALYNELTKTIHAEYNAAQDPSSKSRLDNKRENQAREALRRYPDLRAGVGYSTLDNLYDRLRREMFGELEITTSPDSCHVVIDETRRGVSPFFAKYFPAGQHTVGIFKIGHEEKTVTIDVAPGGKLSREVVLKKIRGKKWWLTRVFAPVAVGVGTILAFVLSGEETPQPEEPEPLPDPPPPPAN